MPVGRGVGANSGHIFCTWRLHLLPAGPGPVPRSLAFLAPIFASRGTGVLERWKTSSKNKPTNSMLFCFLVPTDLQPLSVLQNTSTGFSDSQTATQERAPQNLSRVRGKRALCAPAPSLPRNFLSPARGSDTPRPWCFFTQSFATTFFHSTIEGPTAFISRNWKMKRVWPLPAHPPQTEI